jgi:hypothetical protein
VLFAAVAFATVVIFVGTDSEDGILPSQTLSTTVDGRTISVGGHYDRAESAEIPGGVRYSVDGHEIVVENGTLTIDGKPQPVEDFHELEIWVTEDGRLQTQVTRTVE